MSRASGCPGRSTEVPRRLVTWALPMPGSSESCASSPPLRTQRRSPRSAGRDRVLVLEGGAPSTSVSCHRSCSIHVSPFSATRTSKRLIQRLSERFAASQTRGASNNAAAAPLGRRVRHSADRLLLDPEPDLIAFELEFGSEPQGSVGLARGLARRQGATAGPVLGRPCDDDRLFAGRHGAFRFARVAPTIRACPGPGTRCWPRPPIGPSRRCASAPSSKVTLSVSSAPRL